MTKPLGFFAVVSLLAVGCGGGMEPESQTDAEQAAPTTSGTVSAQASVTLYNQSFTPTCATRDVWKLNTAFFCPSGSVGVAVTAHDPCTTSAGSYRYADITCRPSTGGAEFVLTNRPPPPTCSTYDDFKKNTASFCPAGYYGAAITTHDACTSTGATYRYADITCYQP
jgi:hypothetical protein